MNRTTRKFTHFPAHYISKMVVFGIMAIAPLCLVTRDARAAAGDLDSTFNPGAGPTQTPGQIGFELSVRDLAVQPDGKTIIVGFYSAADDTRSIVLRLNVDGSFDTSFSLHAPFFLSRAKAVKIQPDGKILIGGDFDSLDDVVMGNPLHNGIVRLNSDGSLDSTFNIGTGAGSGFVNKVNALALQPDGKILIGGHFTQYNGVNRGGIARLNPDGTLDTTFDPGTGVSGINQNVLTLALQPDGKILIGGSFSGYNGISRHQIARLNANGSLDATFNPGTGPDSGSLLVLTLQTDGKVIIGGSFTQYNGSTRNRIVRINSNGSLDTSFNPGIGANGSVFEIGIQPDGKILVGGQFSQYASISRGGVARINVDGSLDSTFDPGAGIGSSLTLGVQALVSLADGKVLVGGDFTQYNGVTRNGIARVNSNGSLDPSFALAMPVNSFVDAVSLQPDGKVLIGGFFSHYNGVSRNNIARLNADGTLDVSFNPGAGTSGARLFEAGWIRRIVLQPDGKILICGFFSQYNGVSRNAIARLNADGSLDTSFNPAIVVDPSFQNMRDMVLQPDGKILIAGFFSAPGVASNIARLNADGSVDPSFNATGVGAYVIALQPDGKLLAGLDNIMRFNANGSVDTSFHGGVVLTNDDFPAQVESIVLQPNGKILIGGRFDQYNGVSRNNVARINCDGTLDTTFNPGTGTSGQAFFSIASVRRIALLLQPDGKIIIGGNFTQYNGVVRNYLTRVNADGTLDGSFNSEPGPDWRVHALALQPDGKTVIGGVFSNYNGVSRKNIARLLTDPPITFPVVQFAASAFPANEGSGQVTINLIRTGDTSIASTIDYRTTDTDTITVNCAAKQGQAFGRCDFATVVGTLTFAIGETSRSFNVPLIDDSYGEGAETFSVVLSNPQGATLGSQSSANVSITDNETVDGPNRMLQGTDAAIDFFVRQNYLDFLAREPEVDQPWSNVVRNCSDQFNTNPNSPAAGCDRIAVSGSFFGSPEFKDKGLYIIGMYRVAFNRLPTYVEFTTDLASITGATTTETFAKRAAYATAFTQRGAFTSIYGAMNNTTFVNALMSGGQGQNYNLTSITTRDPANPDTGNKITLTNSDLINSFGCGTRAQVLRAIVQSDQITQNLEAVNAFVASQYYGYLRRAPDTGGFNGWVTYLKNNPSDFRTMVHGFLNSPEYRLRFGPLP